MSKKVVGYIRVSSESQVENTSISDQENRIRLYCELHNFELVHIYSDEGKSGSNTDLREEYQKMLEFTINPNNGITAIIVNKIDRIHRSGKNLLIMVEDQLEPNGIAFVSITEQFDTSTPMGKLFLAMLGSFAEFERATINARTKGGRIAKAKKNGYAGGSIAFGYILVDKEKFTLEVHPQNSKVVKTIFIARLKGDSMETIAKYLNISNILHDGKLWNKQAISYILNNRIYCGNYQYNGKKEKNGIDYFVPMIIDGNLWDQVHAK